MYEFGKFRCDPREHLLLCDGKPVSLAPKSFEILVVLIQNHGRLLTKDELMHLAWPDSFVEEGNLTVNISALRKVLGETPDGQQYIETVPKRGYRFVAPVREASGAPAKAVSGDGSAPDSPQPAMAAKARRWWLMAVAALPILALVASVLISLGATKLTDKDTVVLADFANSTGDPVFDGALRQGLSAQLEQSPFLHLLSDDRIAQTLSLMARPKDSPLTHELGREVCQRTGSAAVLDGAIAQVGTQYLLTLKAINCANGESLGSAEAQAADKNHVLDAMGKVASAMRNQLGESLASVQKYDAPSESVTTPSLEALKAYSLGYQAMVVKSDYGAALPLFQRAISLDPNFAMAYARMGTSYFNLYETQRAMESVRRAYELREHLSERERLYITSHYELVVTGNLDAARKVFELLEQTYPREAPYTNLGIVYSQLGEYDKAMAAFEKAVRIGPATGNRYANLINGYLQLGQLDQAKATVSEAQAKKMDSPEIHVNLYWADFLQHDDAGMEREAEYVQSQPGYSDQMLNFRSDTALYRGQLVKSRAFARSAVDAARKGDDKEAAAVYEAQAAVREALVGNHDLAIEQAQSALASSNGRDVEGLAAIAFGMAGDSNQAGRLADDLAKRFPEDTIVQSNYLPTLRALAALRTNSSPPADSVAGSTPHQMGANLLTLNFILYPVYVRGQAYLAAKQGAAAAAEFQKVLDHPGAIRTEPIAALAHLQLGRAYVLSGDTSRARSAYQDFFNLWKDADPDPDIPLLKDARSEYLTLN